MQLETCWKSCGKTKTLLWCKIQHFTADEKHLACNEKCCRHWNSAQKPLYHCCASKGVIFHNSWMDNRHNHSFRQWTTNTQLYRVFQVSFECKHCYSPYRKCFSTPLKRFICFKMKFQFQHMVFQHITKNCQTQSSLRRVENHAVDFKNYYDGNEMSDRCGTTFCVRYSCLCFVFILWLQHLRYKKECVPFKSVWEDRLSNPVPILGSFPFYVGRLKFQPISCLHCIAVFGQLSKGV